MLADDQQLNTNFKYYLTIVKELMSELMRQEIEVWDVLPAIRRELAKVMVTKHKLSQRETADRSREAGEDGGRS